MTKIICLEGITGAGKTTQGNRLWTYLEKIHAKALVINVKQYEPFKSVIINWHREGANQDFTEDQINLFALAQGETYRRNFTHLIGKVDYLIFDRGIYTSGVYQAGRLSCDEIIEINLREGV